MARIRTRFFPQRVCLLDLIRWPRGSDPARLACIVVSPMTNDWVVYLTPELRIVMALTRLRNCCEGHTAIKVYNLTSQY